MISYILNESKMLGDNQLSYIVGTCLSVDSKPVIGIYFGSMLFETDTQTWYVFDKTKVWKKSASSGGTTVIANPTLAGTESDLTGLQVGGTKYKIPSGGSGSGVFVVHDDNNGNGTLDKTWKEINDALSEGPVFVLFDAVSGGRCCASVIDSYIDEYDNKYIITASIALGTSEYNTDNENGYPSNTMPTPK